MLFSSKKVFINERRSGRNEPDLEPDNEFLRILERKRKAKSLAMPVRSEDFNWLDETLIVEDAPVFNSTVIDGMNDHHYHHNSILHKVSDESFVRMEKLCQNLSETTKIEAKEMENSTLTKLLSSTDSGHGTETLQTNSTISKIDEHNDNDVDDNVDQTILNNDETFTISNELAIKSRALFDDTIQHVDYLIESAKRVPNTRIRLSLSPNRVKLLQEVKHD